MLLETAQVILTLTGVVFYLFHHRRHLPNLIWRPYVLLLFGLGAVFLLKNTSKLLCFATWLFFVCLHYFKDLEKGNESECPICFEGLKTSFPYECIRCKKATHARCVVEYLEHSGEGSFRCPFCRKDLRVKKEELKLAIERFETLMGASEDNETLENAATENPPTTTPANRQGGKLLSLLSALKTITLVSIMVTFYGSYQLCYDSYRELPKDLKTFSRVFLEDAIQFVRGPMRSLAQKMYGLASIVIKFIKEGTTVKRIALWVLRTVRTVATCILNSSALDSLKKGAVDMLNFLVYTFPTLAHNFAREAYRIAKETVREILNSRFIAEVKEDIYILFSFTFRTFPTLVIRVVVAAWRSRTAEVFKQKTLDAIDFAFKTLPGLCRRIVYFLSVTIRQTLIVIWYSQFLSNTMNALRNVTNVLYEFMRVHGVYAYNNVLIPLAKVLYDLYWIICEALYKVVIFAFRTVLPIGISLCKDFCKWLRIKVPELLKMILSSSRLLWSYTSLVLREWWIAILNSQAWVAVATAAQYLKWAAINAVGIVHNLAMIAKRAAVVGLQLSRATVRKMTELLLTSKIVFAAIMHSHVVEHMIVPSVMYAGAKGRELAQSTAQYLHTYGPRVRESMLDAMWSAYNYDYNGVLHMVMESFRGVMRRVLYRDANAVKT
uniref:RING-type domain-containing protein n=1 Tax=Branchiostoma floridae TaxID=7739 RepID=C3Y8Y0_BRAFL|eukprot:XP_002607026.1 hypothetical protein BRAFLDRAFT_93592 [Branchiostoma floridae]